MGHDFIETRGQRFNPIPSLFTLCNAICGFTAIALVMGAYARGAVIPPLALWLIFIAMLFDVLDGLIARLLNVPSMHGMNLDSLADAISFGAAPAIFIYALGIHSVVAHSIPSIVVRLLAGLYLCCALWRLALYNTRAILEQEKEDKVMFVGLPSPAAAAMVCCMVWLLPKSVPAEQMQFYTYVIYTLVASLLMISTTPYPHLRNLMSNWPKWLLILLGLFAAFLIYQFSFVSIIFVAHFYIISTPLADGISKMKQKLFHKNITP